MDDIKLQRYFIDQARPSKEKYDYVLDAMQKDCRYRAYHRDEQYRG